MAMVARVWFHNYRLIWIAAGVALVHAAIYSWVLNQRISVRLSPPLETIDIEFAEVLVEPEPVVPIQPDAITEPVPRSPPTPTPAAPTPNVAPSPPTKTVLTQLEPAAAAAIAPPASAPSASAGTDQGVSPHELASALKVLECQKLRFKTDETCPKPDPFQVAEASRDRQESAPADPLLVGDYGPKSMLEGFLSQRDKDPYLMPGMSGDLFTDGMAPGAYNAQRIRNGQAPLWDKEIEDGFRIHD